MKTQRIPLPFGDRSVLDFEANASQLEVVPVKNGEAPCLEWEGAVAPEVRREGEVVMIHPSSRGFWGALEMGSYKMTLRVPPQLKARMSVDMGRLTVSHLAGCDLDLSTSAGSLELHDVRGRMKLTANAGQIKGDLLAGTFEVECGAGSARLGIVALDPGEHHVQSNMGSVRIELAPGIDVRIEANTVMGSTRTKYPTNPKSTTVLKLEADLGSVRIGEGSGYSDPRHGDWPDWRKLWDAAGELLTARPARPPAASPEELRQILSMVEAGKINAAEAERLIRAISGQ